MSAAKDERITAEELRQELASDPEYFAETRAEQLSQEEHERRYEDAARPILEDLAAAGFNVNQIKDVAAGGSDFRDAVPVLLRWLGKTGNYHVEQELVRTLADRAAKPQAGRPLLEYFERLDSEDDEPLKSAVANSLSVVAGAELADDLMRLAQDPSHGRSREMLVVGLGRLDNPRVVRVARQLLDDEQVAGHAVIALGDARAVEARKDIERFTQHEKAWVREEARRALRKIEGAG